MPFTQCIQISNQHNAHIKYFTILFVDNASVKLKSVKESQGLPSPKEPLQTPVERLRGQFENDCYKEMEVIYFSYFFFKSKHFKCVSQRLPVLKWRKYVKNT